MIERIHLGLPFWGFDGWRGGLYPRDARPSDHLGQYARVFNAVEGNTTFYADPSPASVARWVAETGEDFVASLPEDLCFAVELRSPELVQEGMPARLADEILASRGIGRVIMDTRPLRDGPGDHPDILAARHKKPDLPVREEARTPEPVVRIVFHPEWAVNEPWLDRWAQRLALWIREGHRPRVFVHSPSNRESPAIARELLRRLDALEPVGSMPAWPGEADESASGQLALL